MKHPLNLGLAEIEVLRFVADHAPVSVRDAADHLAATKGQVRTTVLNSMERLRLKGFLRRRKVDGIYQYSPVETRAALFQRLLGGFVEAAFGGAQAPLAAFLAESSDVTPDEIDVLRKLAARLEPPR